MAEQAKTPIFQVFDQQKSRAYTANDEFFKKVEQDRECYFKNVRTLRSHFESRNFSEVINLELIKELTIIFVAQEQGFIDAQWKQLFAIKNDENFKQVVNIRYEYVKKYFPQIPAAWDKEMAEVQAKKQRTNTN